jgi:Domain of unknown function (DUF6458)
MRIGSSLLLIAIGAVLRFAVTTDRSHGVNVWTIGVILMIVGAVGLAISLALMTTRRRTDVRYRPDGATYVEPARTDIDPRY